ncbi:MAG TPA: hypothetical protein VM049_09690 [Gaiellaceae bacterium]|nr:hypothetical protein [Gaiellaceae bacterium]
MIDERLPFVLEADVRLQPGTDPAALGAAVTTALCGHWEHEGPCRWPHNNEADAAVSVASFRTIFVSPAEEEPDVRTRIEGALRGGSGWELLNVRARPLRVDEEPLAGRLASSAR